MHVGKYINITRENLGLTLAQIEDRTGVTAAWIGRIENGSIPSSQVLAKIADALGVSRAILLLLAGHIKREDLNSSLDILHLLKSGYGEINGTKLSPEQGKLLADHLETLMSFVRHELELNKKSEKIKLKKTKASPPTGEPVSAHKLEDELESNLTEPITE